MCLYCTWGSVRLRCLYMWFAQLLLMLDATFLSALWINNTNNLPNEWIHHKNNNYVLSSLRAQWVRALYWLSWLPEKAKSWNSRNLGMTQMTPYWTPDSLPMHLTRWEQHDFVFQHITEGLPKWGVLGFLGVWSRSSMGRYTNFIFPIFWIFFFHVMLILFNIHSLCTLLGRTVHQLVSANI